MNSHRNSKGKIASITPYIVGVIVLITSTGSYAADECGVEAAGDDTLTCTTQNYPSGITYTASDGLTLVIDNNGSTIDGAGVSVTSLGATSGNITITGTDVGTLTSTGYGLYANITDATNTATATVTMTAGDITAGGHGLYALNAGMGDVLAQMDGGTTDTTNGHGVRTEISNINSTATATATTLVSGTAAITTTGSGSSGVSARTLGLGSVLVQMNGDSSVETEGQFSYGILAYSINTSNLNTTTAQISDNVSITTTGNDSVGAYTLVANLGDAFVLMNGGTIDTTGTNSSGLSSSINNASSAATSTATLTTGDVITRGVGSNGILTVTRGTGVNGWRHY